MSQFISFQQVEVTNPTTGIVSTKFRVVHKDGHSYTLLTDLTKEQLIADKPALLGKITLYEGEFGTYAVITRAKILAEF